MIGRYLKQQQLGDDRLDCWTLRNPQVGAQEQAEEVQGKGELDEGDDRSVSGC